MSVIQVGNRNFEVIAVEDVGKHNLTHAISANSTLADAQYVHDDDYYHNDQDWIELTMPNGYKDSLFLRNMEYYDILLLREINAKPFEFVGEVFSAWTLNGSALSAYIEVPDKYLGKKFRLIEVI
jgi:hypothetical protein